MNEFTVYAKKGIFRVRFSCKARTVEEAIEFFRHNIGESWELVSIDCQEN